MAAISAIILLMLACLAGCPAPSRDAARAQVALDVPASEDLSPGEDPAAKALYYFSVARLTAIEGDYPTAAAALEKALKYDPRSAYLHLFLAEIYLSMDEVEKAVRAAEDALIHAPDDARPYLLLGNIHFEQGRDADAIDRLQKAIELAPEQQEAHLRLGVAYARSGDSEQAVAVLKKFLQRKPDSLMAGLTLARVYREIGLSARAVEVYRELMERRPDIDAPYLELSSLYQSQGELAEAVAILRQALEQNPANNLLRLRVVRLLVAARSYREALQELDLVIRQHPEGAEGYRLRGLILMEQERWPEAENAFSRALSLAPGSDRIRFYLGTVYERQQQWQKAYQVFGDIESDNDLYADATSHMAYLLHRMKRIDEALALLKERLPNLPPKAELYSFYSTLYQEQGDIASAQSVLEEGLNRLPQSADLHYHLGLLLESEGKREAAVAIMLKAIELNENHAEALNYLAYSFAEQGIRLDEALKFAQRALALNNSGHILDTLGWVYFKLGRFNEARPELEAAATLLADDAIVQEHLADLYRELRLYERARRAYRKVLEIKPDNPAVRQKLEALPNG